MLILFFDVKSNSRHNKVDMVFTKKDGTYSRTDMIKYSFPKNGCKIKDIAEVLGHKRTETTQKYLII